MSRGYEMTRRAAATAETRRRITEAAVELHEELGPARTTISAIAERAGVQRLTVYRHFPGEAELFTACSAHWREQNPPPDPNRWATLGRPREKLRVALRAFYEYYGRAAPMLANVLRDEPEIPVITELMTPFRDLIGAVTEDLLRGWEVRGKLKKKLAALVAHALEFETWRSFERTGLTPDEAAELMAEAASAVAGARG